MSDLGSLDTLVQVRTHLSNASLAQRIAWLAANSCFRGCPSGIQMHVNLEFGVYLFVCFVVVVAFSFSSFFFFLLGQAAMCGNCFALTYKGVLRS